VYIDEEMRQDETREVGRHVYHFHQLENNLSKKNCGFPPDVVRVEERFEIVQKRFPESR
jgi:hypothetical protein